MLVGTRPVEDLVRVAAESGMPALALTDTDGMFAVVPFQRACKEVGIRPIMPCTERTVIGMADGYTRVNNGKRIGVCAVQQGPGIENTFGGVAQAYSDSSPVLVFPSGPPQSRQGSLPTFDPVPSYQHVSKWAARINQAGRIPEFLRRAFTYLRVGRPGPVVLEIPQDVAMADLEDPTRSYKLVQASRALAASLASGKGGICTPCRLASSAIQRKALPRQLSLAPARTASFPCSL
jgi:acetolactate synthase-1/2/3 large subunit